jgi:hypothetical protein
MKLVGKKVGRAVSRTVGRTASKKADLRNAAILLMGLLISLANFCGRTADLTSGLVDADWAAAGSATAA